MKEQSARGSARGLSRNELGSALGDCVLGRVWRAILATWRLLPSGCPRARALGSDPAAASAGREPPGHLGPAQPPRAGFSGWCLGSPSGWSASTGSCCGPPGSVAGPEGRRISCPIPASAPLSPPQELPVPGPGLAIRPASSKPVPIQFPSRSQPGPDQVPARSNPIARAPCVSIAAAARPFPWRCCPVGWTWASACCAAMTSRRPPTAAVVLRPSCPW
jgi:hypothetical protein